jgi:hypothetical protein
MINVTVDSTVANIHTFGAAMVSANRSLGRRMKSGSVLKCRKTGVANVQLITSHFQRVRSFILLHLNVTSEISTLKCDAWMTCSRSEGFNLPALEAMACRTPVVLTLGIVRTSASTSRQSV